MRSPRSLLVEMSADGTLNSPPICLGPARTLLTSLTVRSPPPPPHRSGKTTLLNHILRADHGKRIVVIENEFGEIDIDGELVAFRENGEEVGPGG